MKKLIGLSLFSNVGIAEAYLDKIGVDIVLANEIDVNRAKFYQEVYPNTKMICGDITNDEISQKIMNEAKQKKVDFIIATPPCQGMSEAGLRKEFDERNQLIYYAVEIIKNVKPKFALIENVPQILNTKIIHNNKIMLIPEYLKKELGNDYNFNKETLIKSKDYGIAQIRERNIFLLSKKDTHISWDFPKKQKEITLEDAIGDLPSLDPMLKEGIEVTLARFPNFNKKKENGLKISKWHFPPTHNERQVIWMQHTPTGKSAIYNDEYYPQKEDGSRIKAHHNNYRRLKWDMPCRTITQNNGVISSLACVHPGREYKDKNGEILYSDPRALSIYELMIVMSLPTDWNIPKWANERFIRKVFGEGIPPKLIYEILLELMNKIEEGKKV